MKPFKDNAGRTWTISVNIDTIKRVKNLLDVNLLEVVDGKLLEKLYADPILLCDVIYAVCKPEADAAKITDEDFGRAMAGDAIDFATTALMEELVSFFPRQRGAPLAKAMEKLSKLEKLAMDRVMLRLDSPELEKKLTSFIDSAGNSPEQSA